jgi:protein phosphatase
MSADFLFRRFRRSTGQHSAEATESSPAVSPPALEAPQFSDIEAWGLTHRGRVRESNDDHFFLGALTQGVAVADSSLETGDLQIVFAERLASLGIVADGVGSAAGGGEAAQIAVHDLVESVSRSFHEANVAEASDPEVFSRLLHDAALECHESLLKRAEREGGERSFATTLTLFLGLWPHAYLLQIGDSRGYVYQNDTLSQITRDQTWAQDLIDSGALTQTQAEKTRWAHMLSSAIGGESAAPVVTRIERDWGAVVLLCSDGLTKHVSDEQIRERLADMTSARQVAEQLLQDALDGGGTDNISIIVGRTLPPGARTPESNVRLG